MSKDKIHCKHTELCDAKDGYKNNTGLESHWFCYNNNNFQE